jgi:hypothetical protein
MMQVDEPSAAGEGGDDASAVSSALDTLAGGSQGGGGVEDAGAPSPLGAGRGEGAGGEGAGAGVKKRPREATPPAPLAPAEEGAPAVAEAEVEDPIVLLERVTARERARVQAQVTRLTRFRSGARNVPRQLRGVFALGPEEYQADRREAARVKAKGMWCDGGEGPPRAGEAPLFQGIGVGAARLARSFPPPPPPKPSPPKAARKPAPSAPQPQREMVVFDDVESGEEDEDDELEFLGGEVPVEFMLVSGGTGLEGVGGRLVADAGSACVAVGAGGGGQAADGVPVHDHPGPCDGHRQERRG